MRYECSTVTSRTKFEEKRMKGMIDGFGEMLLCFEDVFPLVEKADNKDKLKVRGEGLTKE